MRPAAGETGNKPGFSYLEAPNPRGGPARAQPGGGPLDDLESVIDAGFVEGLRGARPGARAPANRPEVKSVVKKRRPASPGPSPTAGQKGRNRESDDDAEEWEAIDDEVAEPAPKRRPPPQNTPTDVMVPDTITVANLAQAMGVEPRRVLRKVGEMGLDDAKGFDYMLPSELASLVVLEFNMNPVVTSSVEHDPFDVEARPPPESWSDYSSRPPVVTIMGHVDHGKTTLLDSLRKTSVAASEAGGITQHIGAFSVPLQNASPSDPPRTVTFLDTPGHAAFSAMRRRGAQTTDIVVLVVAADDGVMPQTIEAIKHSKEANVPIIVAVNKCDKPGAKPEKVLEGLIRENVQVEDMGGDVPCVMVSGLKGTGLDQLVETISTVAEIQLDVRGDATGPVEAVVLETELERGRGNVATVLVKRGTLRTSQLLVAGTSLCRVRSIVDESGKTLTSAGPSTPVQVLGWRELPAAGDLALEIQESEGRKAEDIAKRVVEARKQRKKREEGWRMLEKMNEARAKRRKEREVEKAAKKKRGSKPGDDAQEADPEPLEKVLPVVVKGDVHGSVEAILEVIQALPQDEVKVKVVSSGVGPVTEDDIRQASVDEGVILAFNGKPIPPRLMHHALSENVRIRQHKIIYQLIDDMKDLLSDMLAPEIKIDVVGEASVQQRFSITVKGKGDEVIAGSKVDSGKLAKNGLFRLMRKDVQLWEGQLKSLKHFKKDVSEISKGNECGIALDGFEDFEPGDLIQSIVKTEIKRRL
ncbi:initiation factor 2 [Gonapodya prolifera JEL478]|uniref:Translation initiation factor IF-2, mitochondrial n=1 Tax=Gonapodya prolifera (strain JEL478) TaxID=1344416 RepID=A0A139ATP2_GONPJ|nr:initiation factor 2 [Gonapodya prolifera JEL478]|eukprot:KXS20098.1 initiation factor 2 [Gonapodya prolifera JEL478]